MIWLLLAICCTFGIGVVMRLSSNYASNKIGLLLVNYVVCILLATNLKISNFYVSDIKLFSLSLINGIFYLLGFVLLQYNISQNGLTYSSIFQRLGILIPIILSIVVFKDLPTLFQVIGIIIAMGAIVFMNEKDGSIPNFTSLMIMFLLGGLGDFISKVITEIGVDTSNNSFLLYTFIFAFISCFILMLYKKEKVTKYELLFGVVLGFPNYFSAKFLLLSLYNLPAMITYPTYSVATIILSSICGMYFFKEKITSRSKVAMGIMILSIILLNI